METPVYQGFWKRYAFLILPIISVWALVVAGVYGWLQYHEEKLRQWQQWEQRLALTAQQRATTVDGWLEHVRDPLTELAGNTSLRLYQTTWAMQSVPGVRDADSPEVTYMQRFLQHAADERGFALHGGGVALLDKNGQVITTSDGMTPEAGAVADLVRGLPVSGRFQDAFLRGDGRAFIGFLEPVFAVQGDAVAESLVGYLYGVRALDEAFFKLAAGSKSSMFDTSASLLMREAGDDIQYITPPRAGGQPLETAQNGREVALLLSDTAAPAMTEYTDERGQVVWGIGQRLVNAPWVLLHRIDRNEAIRSLLLTTERNVAIFALAAALLLGSLWFGWQRNRSQWRQLQLREERGRAFFELASSLMVAVDQRDQHATHHSRKVGRLARLIAEEMHQDEGTCETVELAGTLMNIGKLFVPRALLTRSGPLQEEEKRSLRRSISEAASLLEGMDMMGPVSQTVRQSQEHWNGQGLLGAREENILLTARIIAVANACVGMLSDRAWRNKMSMDDVVMSLQQESNKTYDPAVVVAVTNLLKNRPDRVDDAIGGIHSPRKAM